MNEDFYVENQETWYDYVYFEPPYDPDAYLDGWDDSVYNDDDEGEE